MKILAICILSAFAAGALAFCVYAIKAFTKPRFTFPAALQKRFWVFVVSNTRTGMQAFEYSSDSASEAYRFGISSYGLGNFVVFDSHTGVSSESGRMDLKHNPALYQKYPSPVDDALTFLEDQG